MNKLIKNIIGCSVLLLTVISCKKEVEPTMMAEVNFDAAVTSSTTDIVLTEARNSETAITLNWPAVKYPVDAAVTYTLQIDVPSDTLTTSPWSEAHELVAGEGATTKSVTVKDLNEIVIGLGLEPGLKSPVVIRVKAFLNRAVYSTAITVNVTPYNPAPPPPSYPSLWAPGAYQGWDPAKAPTIASVASNGIYEGYLDLPAGAFKFTKQPAWDPMAYGPSGGTTVANGTVQNLQEANFQGGDFNIATSGFYFVNVNTNTMKYRFIRIASLGIIGDATPGGWNTDTDLIYNAQTKTWAVTLNMVPGGFKFRANDTWTPLSYGTKDGKLAHSDHPDGKDNATADFSIAAGQGGSYTITLNFSVAGSYTYTIKKN